MQVGGLSLTAAGRLRLLLDGEQLRQPNAPIASHRPPLSLRCQDNARHKLSSELPLPGEEKSSSLKREREKVEDCGSCAMDLLSSGREAGGRKRRILVGTRRETSKQTLVSIDPNLSSFVNMTQGLEDKMEMWLPSKRSTFSLLGHGGRKWVGSETLLHRYAFWEDQEGQRYLF